MCCIASDGIARVDASKIQKFIQSFYYAANARFLHSLLVRGLGHFYCVSSGAVEKGFESFVGTQERISGRELKIRKYSKCETAFDESSESELKTLGSKKRKKFMSVKGLKIEQIKADSSEKG